MSTFEDQLSRQAAIIRHIQNKYEALDQLYRNGLIATLAALKESFEKTDRALALNREQLNWMKQTGAQNGAVYAEQIPGKREPFWINKQITINAGSVSRVTASEAISSTGPFEIAQIMAVAQISVPYGVSVGAVLTEARFRSCNSAVREWMAAPNPGAAGMPSYAPDTTINGICDFFWDYQTGSSNRRRSNAPIPSAFLFTEQGRPAYLATGDLLPPADSIGYAIDPLFPSRAWLGGVMPGAVEDTARAVIINFCFHGALYAQAPDWRP